MSGTTGRAPAAITTSSAVMVSPVPVSMVRSPTKRACPSNSVTFGFESARQSRPPEEIGSMRPKMRSRITGQRTPSSRVSMPSSPPCRAASARSAG